MLFEPNEPATWRRAAAQVRAFLGSLEERGAFAHREPGDRWFVLCDERVNREQHRQRGIANLLYGFAAARSGEFHAYMVSHRAGGSRTQPVSPNLTGLPDTGITQALEVLELPPDRQF
jgi:phage tail sheath protein FI